MKQSLKKIAAATFALSIVFTSGPVLDVLPASASTASHQILSELTELNDDTTPGIEMNENGVARSIDGQLSDTQVENDEDAKEVLRNISELLGVKDTEQELKFKGSSNSSYNTVYTFKQYYKDLELTNSYITIIVNNSTGRSDFLNSSFIPDFSMDVNPDVSASNAAQIVMEQYSVTLSEAPRLVIYSMDNTVHHLAWEVKTDSFSPSMVYLDAKNGEILYAEMPSSANDEGDLAATYSLEKDSPLSGPFTVDIARDKDEENLYKLHDTERNIYVLDSRNFYGKYINDYTQICSKNDGDVTNKSLVIKKEDNSWDGYETELAVLYNVQKAYDFYDELMWTGTDDKNCDLFIVPQFRAENGTTGVGIDNAYAMFSNTLVFGAGNGETTKNWGLGLDTVVHEYTHRVTDNKIHWRGTHGEAHSLDEAYSDIMAEYADGTDEWQQGTYHYLNGTSFVRDLANPTSNPAQYYRYTSAEHFQYVEEHCGSTVISHAAYLMHKLGIPDHVGKKLWYISLDYLPKGNNATFADCRTAINKAADKVFDIYSYSKRLEWAYIIRKAFNTVNIRDKYDLVGDVNLDFKIDENDITDLKDYLDPDKTFKFTQPVQEHYCDLNADGVIDDADVAYLEKVVNGQITITKQPQNTTRPLDSLVSLSVEAEGEELTYEWYSDHSGNSDFKLECSTQLSSIKNPWFDCSMTPDRNGQQIYCIITDKYNHKIKTDTITLTSAEPITVISQPPQLITSNYGDTVTLSVKATGVGLKYTWRAQYPGEPKWFDLGNYTDTYEFTLTEENKNIIIWCTITDAFDETQVTPFITFQTNSASNAPNTEAIDGDVNGDGILDISDAIFLARFVAEDSTLDMSNFNVQNADVNGDGLTSAADTVYIIRKIAKLI